VRRYNQSKLVFMEQREEGFNVWEGPLVMLPVPFVAQYLAKFQTFPPRQPPGTFSFGQVTDKMKQAGANQ
jgi:arylsulfatase